MKLIILDRDGVINHDSADYIKHPDEWTALPGSLQAIARLHQAGYTIAVASNQSGLARGLFDITALTAIHQKLRKELGQLAGAIDAFFNDIMVMADDLAVRDNRLALLAQLHGLMNQVADISRLAA